VHRVYGCCPIAVEGDKLVFDIQLQLDECKISSGLPGYFEGRPQICSVAFRSIYPYAVAMSFGVSATDLGIAKSGEDGYVLCPAWGPPTCEAAVVFRLHPEPIEKGWIDRFYEHLAKAGHVSVPTFYFERFASKETKENRRKLVQEWIKAGRPKFWNGWRNLPCQPRRDKQEP
jgi:uncharacterized repeat protein (TIGR04076 family)